MKKYFMMALAAIAAMTITVSCDSEYEPTGSYDEVSVSQSYVSLSTNGGSATTQITADGAWEITGAPSWLTVSPTTGSGSATVTFSAESTMDGRNAALKLTSAGKTQYINVIQGLSTVATATCAEVIAGPDSKTYQTKGVVTAIANTTYGNFYINDGTGEVYIYGTLYGGKTQNNPIVNNNIEVGDEVTVQGPKTTYNGTVELVDVTVVKVSKSLIKCDSLTVNGVVSSELPIEGGDIVAYLTNKGNGLYVEVPAAAQSWLSIKSVAGNTVTFHADANEGGDRSTTLVFSTTDGKKNYTNETTISQKGAVIACSVADFLAAAEDGTQYRLKAAVTSVNGKNVYVRDYSGDVLVYNPSLGDNTIKVGDIITVVGKRASYKGNPQMGSPVVEEVIPVTTIGLAEFKALADDKTTYYLLTGKVAQSTEPNTKFDLETYGNFALVDEAGTELYVYGVSTGVGGESKKFGTLGVKEGDTLTIIAYKASYTKNDYTLHQAGGAMFFSNTPAE